MIYLLAVNDYTLIVPVFKNWMSNRGKWKFMTLFWKAFYGVQGPGLLEQRSSNV